MLDDRLLRPLAQRVLDRAEEQKAAAKILQAILLARSPRRTDIGRPLASHPETGRKDVQRVLARVDPWEALPRLRMPEATWVLGEVPEVPRPQARKTPYVGRRKEGGRGFWGLVFSDPYRGRAIPLGFPIDSSRTLAEEARSRNLAHREALPSVRALIGGRVRVRDREFRDAGGLETLTGEVIRLVLRWNPGAHPPLLRDRNGERIALT